MKIISVCGSKTVGGEQVILSELGREFLRRGIQWEIFCLDSSGSTQHFYKREGLSAQKISPTMRSLKAAFLKQKPDIVETSYLFCGPLGQVTKQLKIPFLWRVVIDPGQFLHNRSWQQHFPSIRHSAAHTVVLSKRFVSQIRGIPRSKISVVPAGIDTARFSKRRTQPLRNPLRRLHHVPARAPWIAMAAHFTPRKRHIDFLLAAMKVHTKIASARFVFFGDAYEEVPETDRYRREVQKAIQTFRAEQFVKLCPSVDRFQWASAIDLLVLPSEGEGHSIAILEAMAAGKPVIGADSGGTPDLIEHEKTGWLVSLRDPDQLAETLLQVLRRPEKTRRCVRRAQKRLHEKFSVKMEADRLLKIYKKLVHP